MSMQIVDWVNISREEYRSEWLGGLNVDNQLWHQSLVTLRRLDEEQRNQTFLRYERTLYHLIRRGVVDHDAFNRPWDTSTRLMRYTAAVGDRLWEMLCEECDRVRRTLDFGFTKSG